MRVSVVICTLDRADSLDQTLDCLRHQSYRDFEVIVVNGPSTDDTQAVLDRWSGKIVARTCPVANLSVSRNIGIRSSSGELVAFIDDDALPDFDWLTQVLVAFDDGEVAGAGGIVFDHTGLKLQYGFSAANRFAESVWDGSEPFDKFCFPGSFQFPYLQGTNAIFRRNALLSVGGFDETYEYYLDETDLCCRLVDAGFRLRQLPNAAVHHKFMPSSVRDHQRVVTNWFPVVKNQVYFSYRHALGAFSEYDILEHSKAFLEKCVDDARFHEGAGRLPPGSTAVAAIRGAEAMRVGQQLGVSRHAVRLGPVDWPAGRFVPFPTQDRPDRRKITFVSSGYSGNVTGGIARFISDVAPKLAARGHEVRVIAKAIDHGAVDFEDGVWVHRVDADPASDDGLLPDVLPHINAFVTASVRELERIGTWTTHDVVYAPLWDIEILGALRHTELPCVVQVATPLAIAGDMAGLLDPSAVAPEMRRLLDLEREILHTGDLFHANSRAVIDTVRRLYVEQLADERWEVVHLGLVDHCTARRSAARDDPDRLRVLYVGRFEVRKGIDTVLEAMSGLLARYSNVDLIAAGEDRPLNPGEPNYGEHWVALHRREPWISRVRFEGLVSDERLHELYDQADIVALPSRYESFGLVMVEAMMHGKALVSTDTSGVRDVVRHGVDGLLVAPGNHTQLAAAIEGLILDSTQRRLLGQSARQRFLDAFHIDRFAERLDAFMRRVSLVQAVNSTNAARDPISTRTGRSAYSLVTGEWACLGPIPSDRAARLCLSAPDRPSTVVVHDGASRVWRVDPDRYLRIPIATSTPRVEVVHGQVLVHEIVSVQPATR